MNATRTVFITGITGNQGGAVAKYQIAKGNSIIGLTRNTESQRARDLKEQGVTLITGDLSHPESYRSELNHADVAFLMQTLQSKKQEIQEGKSFIDAIDTDNGPHLVYSSVLGADLNTGIPHFDSKFELENHIRSKNLNHTILRPASFYENHLMPRVASDIRKGKYVSPLKSTCTQQMIGIDDIGKIASSVINNVEKYQGQIIPMATDEWVIGDLPKVFSEAIDKPVKYKKLPGLITRLALGSDLAKMFRYMNNNDFKVVENVQAVRDEFGITGDLKTWIGKHFGN